MVTLIIVGTVDYVGTRRNNGHKLAEVRERFWGKNSLNVETETHEN